jgi:hypothetical protein
MTDTNIFAAKIQGFSAQDNISLEILALLPWLSIEYSNINTPPINEEITICRGNTILFGVTFEIDDDLQFWWTRDNERRPALYGDRWMRDKIYSWNDLTRRFFN